VLPRWPPPGEVDLRGIAPQAQHYEPETDGRVAKFIQALNERVLGIERFGSLEQIRGYGTRAGPAICSRTSTSFA
jgi:hypothetical protein